MMDKDGNEVERLYGLFDAQELRRALRFAEL